MASLDVNKQEKIEVLKAQLENLTSDEGYFASFESESESKAKQAVLNSLNYAPRTRYELQQKLEEKEFDQNIIEKVLDRFEEIKVIDDEDFAIKWVNSRSKTKKLASSALRRELHQKGVDSSYIESALSNLSYEEERATAEQLVEKRLERMDGLERQKKVRRLIGLLQRKGYSPDITFDVINKAVQN
ncbi:MAG: regulatory protein RecX [Micrococcaceae bacterium]